MMLRSAILLATFALFGGLNAQNLPMRTVTALPAVIGETSGLIVTGPNRLWSHNDSGGEAKLYAFDTLGTLLRTLVIRGVSNVDWEEITQDSAGNVYIGDFGNNDNLRNNLRIYKIPNPDNVVGDSVTPETIHFAYPDQFAFPPADSLRYFDMEAMVALGDSLYLFSKNRTDPFDGLTKCYSLPQDSGSYVAQLKDSVVTCASGMFNCWVTAAGLSPSRENMVLLAYGKLWLYSCYEESDFFGGGILERGIAFSQTEGVAWKDATHLYLTDELLNGIFGRNLYEINLGPYLAAPFADLGPDTTVFLGDSIVIGVPTQFGATYQWNTGQNSATIAVTGNSGGGTYILQTTAINGCRARDTIIVSATVGILSEKYGFEVAIQPNPVVSAGTFEIFGPPNQTFEWKLSDLQGKLVASGELQLDGSGRKLQDVPKMNRPGIYFLEVECEGGRKTKKLLKL